MGGEDDKLVGMGARKKLATSASETVRICDNVTDLHRPTPDLRIEDLLNVALAWHPESRLVILDWIRADRASDDCGWHAGRFDGQRTVNVAGRTSQLAERSHSATFALALPQLVTHA